MLANLKKLSSKSKTRIKNGPTNMKMTWDDWSKISQKSNGIDTLFSKENDGEPIPSIMNKRYINVMQNIVEKLQNQIREAGLVDGEVLKPTKSQLKLYGIEKILSFDELSELGEPSYQIELNGTRLRIPSHSKRASGGVDSFFKAISYALYNQMSVKKIKGQIFHTISQNWKTWEKKLIDQNPNLFSSKRGSRAFKKYEKHGYKIPSEVELEVAAEFYEFDYGLVTIVPSGNDGELALQVKNWSGPTSDHPRPRYYFLRTDCYIGELKTHQFTSSWQFLEPINPEPKFKMDKPIISDGFYPLKSCFRKVVKVRTGQERNYFNPEYYKKKQSEKPFKSFRDGLADKILPTCLAYKGKTYICQDLNTDLDESASSNGISSILSKVLFKDGTLLSEDDINEIIKLGKVHYYSYLANGREPSDPFQIPGMTRSSLRKFYEEFTDDNLSDLKIAAGIFYFSFIVLGLDGEGNVFTSENQHSSSEVLKYKRMYYSSQLNGGSGTDSEGIDEESDDEWMDLGENEIEFESKKAHQKELEEKLKQLRKSDGENNCPTLVFLQKYSQDSSTQMKWIYMKEVDFNSRELSYKIQQKLITRARDLKINDDQDQDEIEAMNELKEYNNIMANVTMVALRNEKGEIKYFGPKLSDFDGYGKKMRTPVKRNISKKIAKLLINKDLNYSSASYHSRSRKYRFANARNESDEVNEKNFNWFVDILYERIIVRLANFFRKLGKRFKRLKNKGTSRVFPASAESGVTEMLQQDFKKVHKRIHNNIKAKLNQLSEAEKEPEPEPVLLETASFKVSVKSSEESLHQEKVLGMEMNGKEKVVQVELGTKPSFDGDHFESVDDSANSTSYMNLTIQDLQENNELMKKETTQEQGLGEHEKAEPLLY